METHWHITNVLQNFLRKFQLNVILDIRRNDWSYALFWTRTKKIWPKHELFETENYLVVRCTFDTFGQHQHPKFESIFTHNQPNTKLFLNSTKNTTISIIMKLDQHSYIDLKSSYTTPFKYFKQDHWLEFYLKQQLHEKLLE